MGGGYNTWSKFFYDFITRYRRNKSEKHKAKLKQLAKRKKELAKELKPILEQVRLIESELSNICDKEDKILNKYSYEVKIARRNPYYEKEYYV
jgi:predicted  nucleic acid-binding Zn-ribbon protein